MLTGLLCHDVKYDNIFSLKKDKWEGLDIKMMAVMHFDLFSFTAHASHLN